MTDNDVGGVGSSHSSHSSQESEQSDAVVPVTVGTVLWAVVLVGLLPFRTRLEAAGKDWWIWVCLTGLVLGVLGSLWVRRRRDAYRRAR